MMTQANDPVYIATSRSNAYSNSCDSSHQHPQTYHHPASAAMHTIPSQPIEQASFDEFLFHDPGHEAQAVHVSNTPKGAFQPVNFGKFGDQHLQHSRQGISATVTISAGPPTMEGCGNTISGHGDAPADPAALLEWYRSIILGLSEENSSLSSQLNEAKREIAQLKAGGFSYHNNNQGDHNQGYAEQNTGSWQNPNASAPQYQGQHPPHFSHDVVQPYVSQTTWGYEPSMYGAQPFHGESHQHRSSNNPFHAGMKRTHTTATEGGVSSSDEGIGTDGYKRPCYWTQAEHQRFLEALTMYKGHRSPGTKGGKPGEAGTEDDGKEKVSVGLGQGIAELIATHVRTRTVAQVRSHAQKYFLKENKKAMKESEKKKKKEEKAAAAALKQEVAAAQPSPEVCARE
mmetsp:Transcript_32277/g.76079  ORF Transcript_32277/g.76079 Transcript_32277/m.76079 type:complete len:400 (-) Transcript_32277:99-1298(-)